MLRDRFRNVLIVRESSHKTALSFAVGVFVGISPLLGVHTVLGLALAWILRLNRLVTLTGVYITNPWSIVPIYTFCTWIGMIIIGVDIVPTGVDWKHLRLNTILQELGHILMPFLVGTTVVATAASLLAYVVVRKTMDTRQKGLINTPHLSVKEDDKNGN